MSRWWSYAGLVAAMVLAAGCKPDYPNCKNDPDCRPGEFCVEGQCQQCRADGDCKAGQVCKAGRCEVGCKDDSQCPAGQSCLNGHCSPCQSDGECGPGGKCNSGRCSRAKSCTSDNECAQDEECRDGVCQSGRPQANLPDANCKMQPVYFEFNESTVTNGAAGTLQQNLACIKQATKGTQLIGHADPRGTDEYNLALSERRAQSVKTYLERLGAPGSKMSTIPKGEMEAKGSNESSWAEDRRVDFQ